MYVCVCVSECEARVCVLWLLVHFSPGKCERFVWTDTSKSHLHYSSAAWHIEFNYI